MTARKHETQCLQQRHPETPEMSGELLEALLTFEKWLSVPQNPVPPNRGGSRLRV